MSQSLRELERSLHTTLFVRGRRLTLTPAGRALIGPARQTLRGFDAARVAVEAVESMHVGRLDIAVVHGMSYDPLAPILVRFRRRFPDMSLRVLHAPFGPEGFEILRRGEAELLLTDHPAPFPRHSDVPVPIAKRMVAAFAADAPVVPQGETVTLAELMTFPLIIGLPERSASQQHFVARLAEAGLGLPHAAVATDHRELIMPLLLAGVGVAVLPEPEGELAHRLGAVVKPLDMPPLRSASIFHRQDPLSPVASAFLDVVRDV